MQNEHASQPAIRYHIPELPSLLLRIGELDQGRKDLFDDPAPLVFVVGENLRIYKVSFSLSDRRMSTDAANQC